MGNKNVLFTASFLALIQLSCCSFVVTQQEQCNNNSRSNYGKTFFLASMVKHTRQDSVTLKIVTNTTGYVNIVVPSIRLNRTYAVTPDITDIVLDYQVRSNTLGKGNKGILLTSTVDVAIFVFDETKLGFGEALLLMPVSESFTAYVVQSYESFKNQFIIVATEDFTTLNISLRLTGSLTYNQKQYVDRDVINLNLNRSETYHLYHTHDLSGSIIESDRPVAVFSGGSCIDIPAYTGSGWCDVIEKQLVPVQHWDYSYIVPPIYPRSKYLVRISAYSNHTKVLLTSSKHLSYILNQGEFWDVYLDTKPAVISSDKVISVAQYCLTGNDSTPGDPYMIVVPGISQFSSPRYVFPTMLRDYYGTFNNYVSVVLKKQFKDQLLYNRSSLRILQEYTVPPPFEQYVVMVAILKNESTHTISSYNYSTPFGVFVYGLALDRAYGFTAGIHFNHTADCAASTTVSTGTTTTSVVLTGAKTVTTSTAMTFPTTPITVSVRQPTAVSGSKGRLRCFSCANLENLRYCDTIQLCQENEVCFVSSGRTADGQIFYSTGCNTQHFCAPNRLTGTDSCIDCCDSEFCNINGCGDNVFPPIDQRGPLCFDCDHYRHPSNCRHVVLCSKYEQCSIEGHLWGGDEVVYKMSCKATHSCPHEAGDQHLMQSRSSSVCRNCCSADFCNVNCTHSHVTAPIIG